MANLLESNPNISIKRSHLNLFENIPGNEDNSNSSQVKFHEMASRYCADDQYSEETEDNNQ